VILTALLRAMRPHQWVKNVFVLAAVVFARGDVNTAPPEDYSDVRAVLLAFAAFCLGSSAIYLLNDVVDIEKDRAHPEKRHRPIAAGLVSIGTARAASVGSAVGALLLGSLAGDPGRPWAVCLVVLAYMVMNLAYSVYFKRVVILDAFFIATGFLFRVKAGGLAADYYVSHWLMLCTFFLALFLALCKRRAEIDLLGEDRGSHRSILREYTPQFLDQMVTLLAATTVVCYTMYTVAPETAAKFGDRNRLVYTVPFVVFGLARYLLLVQTQKGGGSPTRVLLGGDKWFVLNCVVWLIVVVLVLFTRNA
jgi:4-hydroxybenzoate polyprenyltransferase